MIEKDHEGAKPESMKRASSCFSNKIEKQQRMAGMAHDVHPHFDRRFTRHVGGAGGKDLDDYSNRGKEAVQ